MVFHPFGVTIPHIVYAALGGFVVLFGMFSLFIREKLYIGEAPLAFVFGVIIGPNGANIFNPRGWAGGTTDNINNITLEVTRVILAVGVFAIGVELPKKYMLHHWKSLFFLLFPAMTWGWFVSAGLIFALIPGLTFLSSLAVAACLTPTDPILAAAVVGGKYADKHVPGHLRHLLAAESGCNDGAAFPFLYIALYLVLEKSNSHAVQDWFLITCLYEVLLGIVLGALLGWAFRHLMKFCEHHDLIDRQSYVAQYISLAMLTIGMCSLLGSDDLLAAFACGTAFAWDGFFNKQTEASVFSSVVDLIFNIAAFIFIGAWTPFDQFSNAALTLSVWRLIVIAICVLLLRRLPIILLLFKWIPDVKTFREAFFSGHFGPIGVGAVFISTLAAQTLGTEGDPSNSQVDLLAHSIQPIVAFMVLCSITIHGLSIPFFTLGVRINTFSRTWSRHYSMDPNARQPEWATTIRHIERPEDIVVNRDREDALERGEVEHEKPAEQSSESSAATPPKSPLSIERAAREDEDGEGEEPKPDQPPDEPDNAEQVTEWQEGDDLVVERRMGPGEEVEVEVIPGGRQEDGPGLPSYTFRGAEEEVRRTVRDKLDKLQDAPRRAQKEAKEATKEAAEGVRHEIDEDIDIIRHGSNGSNGSNHHDHHEEPERPRTAETQDEEGWASEPEDENNGGSGSIGTSSGRQTSQSPPGKRGKKQKQGSRRRNLAGIRRSLFTAHSAKRTPSARADAPSSAPSSRPQTPPTPLEHSVKLEHGGSARNSAEVARDAERDADESRGRRPRARPKLHLRPQSMEVFRPVHSRVGSLRSPLASRSASPARSILIDRSADDSGRHTSGTTTPRGDEPESSRRVAFDLPDALD